LISKIQEIDTKCIDGEYLGSEILKILTETFDSSNPCFTELKNSKVFQIKLNKNDFKIRKIDKINDSSDPLYMALTQIRGEMKNEGESTSIKLFSELHLLWLIVIIAEFMAGLIHSLFYNLDIISLIPMSIIMYIGLRYLAKKDLEKFALYFESLIEKAKIK
jgi:hypothetical protein